MSESNNLLREEDRMKSVARRLQEQVECVASTLPDDYLTLTFAGSELQDVLLDLNDEARIPSFLRFDLGPSSPSASVVPSLESDESSSDPTAARELSEARKKFAKGLYTGDEYSVIESELVSKLPTAGPKTFSSLLGIPHTHYPEPNQNLPEDLVGDLDDLPGYLSPNHETSYIDAVDKAMADPAVSNATVRSAKALPVHQYVQITDKELSLVNPVSPLNWLRKYQPQVFLQDPRPDENPSEKAAPASKGAGRGKRARQSDVLPRGSISAIQDEEEGDGTFVPETGAGAGTGRGRKTKANHDDDTYRPKGGGRGGKRKRGDDGEPGARKRGKGSRASLPS